MTPQDIATDITAVNSSETVGLSTNFTYSSTGLGLGMDDSRTYD